MMATGTMDKAKTITKTVTKTVRSTIIAEEDNFTWEELKTIEKRRRAILKRANLPFFRMLLFWDGTVLKALSEDALMYLTVLIYSAVRVGARVGLPDFVADLGGADIGVIGAFLSFFLVLYVNACTQRFDRLYNTSMSCENRIFDAAALARTTLPREKALRLIRYMNALVRIIFFHTLSK